MCTCVCVYVIACVCLKEKAIEIEIEIEIERVWTSVRASLFKIEGTRAHLRTDSCSLLPTLSFDALGPPN